MDKGADCEGRMYATKDSRRHARAERDALAVLVSAQREREPSLGEHVEGVARLARAVGEAMGLLPGQLVVLERSARLHDVGKIAIPDTILSKPGPLDEAEWALMRQHTILGERILASASSLASVARIVRSTHERVDGRGYPDGLIGDEIPLAARIVFACDAFHAMISSRPYSERMTTQDAMLELRRGAGSQFDASVVSALTAIVGESRAAQMHSVMGGSAARP
jgi:two-component system cell cycle response regulator